MAQAATEAPISTAVPTCWRGADVIDWETRAEELAAHWRGRRVRSAWRTAFATTRGTPVPQFYAPTSTSHALWSAAPHQRSESLAGIGVPR